MTSKGKSPSSDGLVLLTEVYSSCDSGYSDCNFAIIDLSQDKLEEILLLRDCFSKTRNLFENLESFSLWDYSTDWVLLGSEMDASPEEDIQKIQNILVQANDESYVAISSQEYEKLATSPLVNMRTECNTLVVTRDSFYWTCTQKYQNLTYDTSAIPFSWLEEALCGKEKSSK